ncbi:MAG: PAS domain-containing protein, partial [Halorhodospira sp.]
MRVNEPVTQRRVPVWDGANILSTTDARGRIRYINEDFARISGYTSEELIGQPHNVIRHPDMPRVVFAQMWQRLQAGSPWMGIIKNRCKNGDHYWVHAYATPILDRHGQISEIQSVRQQIRDEAIIARAEHAYQRLRAAEPDKGALPEELAGGRSLSAATWALGGAAAGALALLTALLLPLPLSGQLTVGGAGIGAYLAGLIPVLSQLDTARSEARQLLDDPLTEEILYGARNDGTSIRLGLLYLATEIQAVAKRLSNDTRRLAQQAQGVREAMHNVRSEAQQQSDETRSVATAMEQMSSTVDEVARNASAAADATGRAGKQTQRGRQTVEQSTAAVRSLVQGIENASSTIERVNEEA